MRKFYKIIFLSGLLVAFTLNAFAQSQDSSLSFFVKGNNSYKEGKYQDAIDVYESILKDREASGAVYYNLGNSYFKLGKLGKAILNYERAQRLTPRDSDLESNYEYALSLMKKFNDEYKVTLLEKVVTRVDNSLTLDEVTLMTFLWVVIGGIIYLLALWLKWPYMPSRVGLLLIFLIFLAHAYIFSVKIQQENWAVAVMESPARFEPRDNATAHFDLVEGAKVEVLRSEGDWVKIRRRDGKLGWVKKEAVEKIGLSVR